MAYDLRTGPENRIPTIAAVAAIHAALGYALVTGLGATALVEIKDNIKGVLIDEPDVTVALPPPPPMEKTDPVPDNSQITAPTPPMPIPRSSGVTVADVTDIPVDPMAMPGTLDLPGEIFESIPTPPSHTPAPPRPRGNPGEWVTTADYPSRDIRMGHQGTTRFSLGVGANGRVTNCTITQSSGWPSLDEKACELLTRRGIFESATGPDGSKVSGSFNSAIVWKIPK